MDPRYLGSRMRAPAHPSLPPSLPQSAGLTPDPTALASALALLQAAKKPLLVFGKGAAYARAEGERGGREGGRKGGREDEVGCDN